MSYSKSDGDRFVGLALHRKQSKVIGMYKLYERERFIEKCTKARKEFIGS